MALTLNIGLNGGGKSHGAMGDDVLPALTGQAPYSRYASTVGLVGGIKRSIVRAIAAAYWYIRALMGKPKAPHVPRNIVTNVPLRLDVLEADFPGCTDHIKVLANSDDPEALEKLEKASPGVSERYILVPKPFSKLDHWYIDWKDELGRGPLIIVDECQEIFPNEIDFPLHKAGEFKGQPDESAENNKIFMFLTKHRHYKCDVIFMTQVHKNFTRKFKDLVQSTRAYTKDVTFSDKLYFVKFHNKVPRVDTQKPIETSPPVPYGKNVYKYYISNTQSKSSGMEARYTQTKRLYQRWQFWLGVALLVALPYGLYSVYQGWFGDGGEFSARPAVQGNAAAVPSGQPVDLEAVDGKPDEQSARQRPVAAVAISQDLKPSHPLEGGEVFVFAWFGLDFPDGRHEPGIFLGLEGFKGPAFPVDRLGSWGYVVDYANCKLTISYPLAGWSRVFANSACLSDKPVKQAESNYRIAPDFGAYSPGKVKEAVTTGVAPPPSGSVPVVEAPSFRPPGL